MATSPLIVVCDDNAHVAQSVEVLLQAAGYRTRSATDALQCVALVRKERPAMILMDIMMPGLDGAQAAALLHDEPEFAELRVALFSALPEDVVRAAVEESGAVGWLPKPFRKDELLAFVRKHAGDPPPRAAAV
jgi:two-component system sensor histidine kinase ChiS